MCSNEINIRFMADYLDLVDRFAYEFSLLCMSVKWGQLNALLSLISSMTGIKIWIGMECNVRNPI